MADTDKTTIVGQWLSVNGAGKYTKTFFDKGFKELRELTEEAVSAIVSDDPALAGKLAGSLEELADPGSDPAPPPWSGPSEPGPGIPALPPKTKLDLSQPTVNVPDVPEFKIPAMLSVNAESIVITHPGDLTQGDWLIIARNSRILYAYTMGNVSDDGEPPQARKAALDWMVPDSTDFFVPLELGATVMSKVTYTAETASYVRAGFDKQQASAGFPFAAASFEREHKERQAGASYQKQLQMIGRWHYPRVQLNLKDCATASERFKTAIRVALDAYDRNTDIKPLLTVFEEFGTAVPSEAILGGQMLLVHTEDYQGTVNEREVEDVISAAVSLKVDKAEGSVGASFQNAQGNKVSGDSVNKATTFTVRGGDATKASDPQSWPGTVKPPSQWAVIGRSKLTPIVDWLPEDLRSRVMTVWPKVPVPPAIWELQDTFEREPPVGGVNTGKAERAQFVLGAREAALVEGARGAVQLACGTSLTPQLGQEGVFGGRASFHRSRAHDIWIDAASVCLPVPAGHNYAAAAPDTDGRAFARFAIAETNLTLDNWQVVENPDGWANYRVFTAKTDGFVFCSLETWHDHDGDGGYATCEVDKTIIAAASVHNYTRSNESIRCASFCAPFAKGSRVEISATQRTGQGWSFQVWRIPSTSQAWKFTKPEGLSLGSYVKADTDGFVNGVVTIPGDGARGILRLDCFKERPGPAPGTRPYCPPASAAAHVYHRNDRWISHSSAMIPVRKDYLIFTGIDLPPGALAAQAQVYFTRIVPVL